MQIPQNGTERFVRDIIDECMVSQGERASRGKAFTSYALFGSENPADAAIYNKTYAYLDDLDSLLYSPISLKFQIGDPDVPNIINEAKGRAAAAKLRTYARQSDTDTYISDAVFWSLVKGKCFIKQMFKRGGFAPDVVMPESIGVMRENHDKLDEDMEAFVHTMLITPYQFRRMIWNHPDKVELERKAKRYMRDMRADLGTTDGAQKQVIVGGLYPFQPAGQATNQTRGIVDWMGGGVPVLSAKMSTSMMVLNEVWVWDDKRADWATFQMVGDDMLIFGKYQTANAYAYDTATRQESEFLKGQHPFTEYCPNRQKGYFWGRSEIVNIALLQEAINSRIVGINKILRKQEDPPLRITGGAGVNQNAISRMGKPGGWWSDSSPAAKMEPLSQSVGEELWGSLHEYERMFDEMGGLPPAARGKGNSGIRSAAHAETMIRMFSPRFKDRALLIERSVESTGGQMLDLSKAYVDKKLIAWVEEKTAGLEAPPEKERSELMTPPVAGQVPIFFRFSDLNPDMTLTVDSHSASPAFSAESKALTFDLLKIGAMGPEDVVQHTDAPDQEELIGGIQRRRMAAAAAQEQEQKVELLRGRR